VLAAGVVAVAAARLPGAASDARAMLAHRGGLRLAWLGVAVIAQIVSLGGSAAAQRHLLTVGRRWLPWRTSFGVVLASTGLGRVKPAGPVMGALGRRGSIVAAARKTALGCGRCWPEGSPP
jgi:hypothetical protein